MKLIKIFKLVFVFYMEKAVAMAVKNNESIERYSGLTEHFRIIEELMSGDGDFQADQEAV